MEKRDKVVVFDPNEEVYKGHPEFRGVGDGGMLNALVVKPVLGSLKERGAPPFSRWADRSPRVLGGDHVGPQPAARLIDNSALPGPVSSVLWPSAYWTIMLAL